MTLQAHLTGLIGLPGPTEDTGLTRVTEDTGLTGFGGADAAYEAVLGWVTENRLSLYPAQDEALLELATGANVILGTPTGSATRTSIRWSLA